MEGFRKARLHLGWRCGRARRQRRRFDAHSSSWRRGPDDDRHSHEEYRESRTHAPRELMLTVGLTGGIGTGKSTVGKMFTELGCHVLDSDNITHELFEPGQPVNAL